MTGLAVAGASTWFCCCCFGGGKIANFIKVAIVAVLICLCCKNRRKIPFVSSWADRMVTRLNDIEARNKNRKYHQGENSGRTYERTEHKKINKVDFDD